MSPMIKNSTGRRVSQSSHSVDSHMLHSSSSYNVAVRISRSEPSLRTSIPGVFLESSQVDSKAPKKRYSEPSWNAHVVEPLSAIKAISFPVVTNYWSYRGAFSDKGVILDSTFIRNKYHYLDEKDVCAIVFPNEDITFVDSFNLQLFENILYIDVGENHCHVESFRVFPELLELHMPLNDITTIALVSGQFAKLKVLDLSCNSLTPSAFYNLGHLLSLKSLNVSFNNMKKLPSNLELTSFIKLETLYLDDNKFTDSSLVFLVLSRFPKLKTLSLNNNKISTIPFIDSYVTNGVCFETLQHWGYVKPDLVMDSSMNKLLHSNKGTESCSFCKLATYKSSKAVADCSAKSLTVTTKRYVKSSMQQNVTYYFDFAFKTPFQQLQELSLLGNRIKRVIDVEAIMFWRDFGKILLTNNPINKCTPRELAPLRDYMVSKLSPVERSCKILDPTIDSFLKTNLISKLFSMDVRLSKQCPCHKLESEESIPPYGHTYPNMDTTYAHPISKKALPLPKLRLCEFKDYLRKVVEEDDESNIVTSMHYVLSQCSRFGETR